MRLLGVDYGLRRIGLAMAEGETVLPLSTLRVSNDRLVLQKIADLCREHRISKIIVGLPVHLDGRSSKMSQRVKLFGKGLAGVTGLSVVYSEEQLTTKTAARVLTQLGKRRRDQSSGRRDQAAATLILKDYLDCV